MFFFTFVHSEKKTQQYHTESSPSHSSLNIQEEYLNSSILLKFYSIYTVLLMHTSYGYQLISSSILTFFAITDHILMKTTHNLLGTIFFQHKYSSFFFLLVTFCGNEHVTFIMQYWKFQTWSFRVTLDTSATHTHPHSAIARETLTSLTLCSGGLNQTCRSQPF